MDHDEERDEGGEGGEGGEVEDGFLDPPKVGNGLGAAAVEQPQQTPDRTPPGRKGGRPKGSRNRTAVEKEQAAATGVGAPTVRPAGRTGSFPTSEEAQIPNEADLLWPYIIEEVAQKGFSPYDMEIRVERKTPLPAIPMLTFDASSVMGDQMTSPATALRQFIENWIHLPSGVMGPALYTVHFCWKNKALFFRRGEIQVGSRNELLAMQMATQARQSQAGAAGMGSLPSFPQQPQQPQQQQQQNPHVPPLPQPWPPQPQAYAPWGVGAPPPQPQQQQFDPDAERAKIRHELEREMEITRMRQELDDLRRRPQYAPPQPPQYGGYPPPQQQRRGVGAPPPQYPPQQYESEDDRIARVVVTVLRQSGVIGQPQPQGVGASPVLQAATAAASGLGDDFERAMETVSRGKKVFKKMKELFDDEGDGEEKSSSKKQGVGAAPEGEEAIPKIRFQGTGQKWKDGREVMMPIDQDGEPLMPTTLPVAMATGFANPFLLEPLAQGVGAVMRSVSTMVQGLGAQQQQQQQPQRSDIHVQQVPQPQGAGAPPPPPVPYYPPQQMPGSAAPAAQPAPQNPPPQQPGGDWDLS